MYKSKLFIICSLMLAVSAGHAKAGKTSADASKAAIETTNDSFMKLRLEPLWLATSELRLNPQFRVSKKISIGPVLASRQNAEGIYFGHQVISSLTSLADYRTTSETVGLRAEVNLNGFNRHGTFFALEATTSNVKASKTYNNSSWLFSDNANTKAEFTQSRVQLTAGYQWSWRRFALNVGGGLNYNDYPESVNFVAADGSKDNQSLSDDPIGLALDVGIAWKF